LIIVIIASITFKRYFPVLGLNCMKWGELDIKNRNVIDLRDYHDSFKEPIPGAINIPIAYLNRYYSEIPNADLYIVASDSVKKNIGARILRKKGFRIIGCSIQNNENKLVRKNNC
jgi:rhodanese-related sulfurtransferase